MGQLGAPVTGSYVSSENLVIHNLGVCTYGALAVRAGVMTILVFMRAQPQRAHGIPSVGLCGSQWSQGRGHSPTSSAQEGGDAEGPAWLLSAAVHLRIVGDVGVSSHPPLSLAVPEFLWILSSLSPDVISDTKWLLMGHSCPAVVWEGCV